METSLERNPRAAEVLYGDGDVRQAGRGVDDCKSCFLLVDLHWSGPGRTGLFIGCSGAAIANRLKTRAQQRTATR